MENKDKALAIITVLRSFTATAVNSHINARVSLAAAEMEIKCMEEEYSVGFQPGGNLDFKESRVRDASKERLVREQILEYAIDVFINKMK